jgi:teichuronic acid biosynthesis glycosyltransferase TuaC
MKLSLERPTVLFLVGANSVGGIQKIPHVLVSQVKAIREFGWQICLYCVDDRTSLIGIVRNLVKLIYLKQHHYPVIIHASYGTMVAAMARIISGSVPLIITFCGDDLLGTPNSGKIWRIREKLGKMLSLWAAKKAREITVMSENLQNVLPPLLLTKTTIIPWGIDLSSFFPLNKYECRQALDWLDWNETDYYVGINGSIDDNQKVKNIQLALQVIESLSNSWKRVHLIIITGFSLEEVRLVLNAVDCLLVTSLHEGSPNIVKEAMACNLPIISVPCGDLCQRLDGVYPSVVSTYQVEDLAMELRYILELNLRSNGREMLLAQKQDVMSIANQINNIYASQLKA